MRNTSVPYLMLLHAQLFLVVLTLLSLTTTTLAQENQELGRMWTFENPPLSYLKQEYGFTPNQEWLDSLRLGSLRLGGEDVLSGFGSASFVSPRGLIMTSTRSVRDAVARTRPRDINMIKTGFVAAEQEQEIRLRTKQNGWVTAAQLKKITNVTDKINMGVTPTDNEDQVKEKHEANEIAILDAARKTDPRLMSQVVSLYNGVMFQLYQYKVYNDVRLAVLPHLQIAHFGGDLDNFTYPRHSISFAFLRAYENGKPADTTKYHFKWNSAGAKKDELVFVSGNPSTTNRWSTKSQIELERDIRIPIEIERLTNALHILKDPMSNTYSGEFDPENPSRHWAWVRTGILRLENDLKTARGNLQGLKNAKLIAQKTAAEQLLQNRVKEDAQLVGKYGEIWDQIADVVQERRMHEARAQFHVGNGLLDVAVDIVRLCDPTETEEHRNHARKKLESWGNGTISLNFHGTAHCLDHLVRARNWLPKDDPFFTKVLDGKSGKEFLDSVIERRTPSWVGYANQRDALVKSGWTAIRDSEDPLIVAARELVILMRKHEKLGEELDAKEAVLNAKIARAMFACYGTEISPDATETLRFTDGVVKGFHSGGTIAPYRTTFEGLYARNAEFENEYPFNLPNIWLDRKSKIDMTKSVNFVSTNDITGGNSGSVVVNKSLEIVGVVVDGNSESLHNEFVFRDNVPRSVSVHVDGIMEALVQIYDARRVVEELKSTMPHDQRGIR